jgi:nicotinamide riboside kinase
MSAALVIALVGAESTGKTTLAAALAGRIAQGHRAVVHQRGRGAARMVRPRGPHAAG